MSVEFEQEVWNHRDDLAAYLSTHPEGTASVLPKIITTGYSALNLCYYFTAGEKEVRAWTIARGTLAPQAAGAIHSDFEKAFIKAEVVAYDDFKATSGGQKR